ncbi:MAG TPA: TAXI family TRAP transporter solute-binding subunit [Syntrophorhabdaceae bacterium]|nr:TAXI family TRAP transporter solute-binding subunit [Syntrophorhabdaceae bacterium]
MKNIRYFVVVMLLVVCMIGLFSVQSFSAELPKGVRFASISLGTTGYLVASGVGNVMTKYSPIKVAVDPVGMHLAVIEMLEKKEADIGVMGTLDLAPYWRGEGPYKGKQQTVLAGMTTTRMFVVLHTTPRTGIKKVQDIRSRRLLADAVPSPAVAVFSDALLQAHGMSRKDVNWMRYSKMGDAVAAITEGRADAVCYPSSSGPMQSLKLGPGYYPVPIEPEPAKKMIQTVLGTTYESMPKGYNAVVEKDTPTLAYYTTIIFRKDLSEDIVYTLVKAALEHKEEYGKVHPLLQEVDAKRAAKIVGVAFHPGAIKYFKEIGVWTSEHEKENKEILTKYGR